MHCHGLDCMILQGESGPQKGSHSPSPCMGKSHPAPGQSCLRKLPLFQLLSSLWCFLLLFYSTPVFSLGQCIQSVIVYILFLFFKMDFTYIKMFLVSHLEKKKLRVWLLQMSKEAHGSLLVLRGLYVTQVAGIS